MKKEYLKAVDEIIESMDKGAIDRGEEWEDKDSFREHFTKNYDMFIPIIEAMVLEDGFSMKEAVMFVYGYAMGRGSVMEFMMFKEDSETIH